MVGRNEAKVINGLSKNCITNGNKNTGKILNFAVRMRKEEGFQKNIFTLRWFGHRIVLTYTNIIYVFLRTSSISTTFHIKICQ